MIYTITVRAGSQPHEKAAQYYALRLAGLFDARLCAVGVWEGAAAPKEPGYGEDSAGLMHQETDLLVGDARKAGVRVEIKDRGEGGEAGLLAEAQVSDVLVVGLPADSDADTQAVEYSLPLLRQAECAVLVVHQLPPSIAKIMVHYQGGVEGKAALKMAGALAAKAGAQLTVLSMDGDLGKAVALTETAVQYLQGFNLQQAVEVRQETGTPDSSQRVLEVSAEVGADLLVMGADPYGLLERFFNKDLAEKMALTTECPLLIAR